MTRMLDDLHYACDATRLSTRVPSSRERDREDGSAWTRTSGGGSAPGAQAVSVDATDCAFRICWQNNAKEIDELN
jgi:hypothetical protein